MPGSCGASTTTLKLSLFAPAHRLYVISTWLLPHASAALTEFIVTVHCSAPTPAGHCVVPLLPSRCCVLCVASRRVLLRVTVYQAAQRITNEALALIQDLEDAERGDGIARTIFSEAWSRAEVGAVSQLQVVVVTCAVLWSKVRVLVVEARGSIVSPCFSAWPFACAWLAASQLSRLPRRDEAAPAPRRPPASVGAMEPFGPALAAITAIHGEESVWDVIKCAYLVWCADGSVRACGQGGVKRR
jgi:hypothetical protein